MSNSASSPPLAGEIDECCVRAVKHSGEAVGKIIQISGVDTYLSEPPSNLTSTKKVILYFPDVFGPFFINAQLLQDYFASKGFFVVGIDYFFGDPVQNHEGEPDFDRAAWAAKSRAQAQEAVPRWVKGVKELFGLHAKYTAVGYCFGGPFSIQLANTDDVEAAAFAHPSSLNEDHFRNIKKPLLLSCAETDRTFPAESRRRAEDILAEIKATYWVQVFSGVSHGFATKGDPNIENSRWAKEESARSVIEWFIRFTKG